MTIEQKAKAYDEALKKLHEIITMDNHPVLPKEIGEFLFPELTESEDVRIKKTAIKILKGVANRVFEYEGVSKENVLAYLEKQKERISTRWSEGDDRLLNYAISMTDDVQVKRFLESFRYQSNRKPSDEQMNYLCTVVSEAKRKHNASVSGYPAARILESLYNDLKKL